MAVAILLVYPDLMRAVQAQAIQPPKLGCEVLIAGGGLGGTAAALEALQRQKQVCLTEISDWIGGQVSQQGVSALDESQLQRQLGLFARSYRRFREGVRALTGEENPGQCWVSVLCFSPQAGVQVLEAMLKPYLASGQLVLLRNTVVKDLEVRDAQIQSVTVLTHIPRAQGENRLPLSQVLEDWYDPAPSALFMKQPITLIPSFRRPQGRSWMVIDATETGELLPLAGIPYRLGTERRTRWEPSAKGADPYCTQSFTYTFVLEQTANAQNLAPPEDYDSPFNGPAYSFEQELFSFPAIFTYRRIRGQVPVSLFPAQITMADLRVGDQSMQNWTWGNDWRLSTADTNLVLTQEQLEAQGQLQQWRGGLRPEALARAEAHAYGYYYWLVNGTKDVLLQQRDPSYRKPTYPNYAFLRGVASPMGTEHGLARYPYIREGRRIIGRPSRSYPEGFAIYETDITGQEPTLLFPGRTRLYPDTVGLGGYPIDFHPCIINDQFAPAPDDVTGSPPNPQALYQIPLRALIPQKIDNLLAGAKNIATTHITNASYRVHPVEWAIGAAAGNTAAFVLEQGVLPAALVTGTPAADRLLSALQAQIQAQGNPIRSSQRVPVLCQGCYSRVRRVKE
ncbi:FAD-dependent oxidoreductase [Anthocerotibacter panamensis]|uniref:FAD-dependent oxidoreductase n=1 Tax=Anthocerotibacter panamensis TaxID=2857077 RepID=UPI001FDA39FE|nr:FAD-dependent oxidoreductase [Anthocerotibacter panamensis]